MGAKFPACGGATAGPPDSRYAFVVPMSGNFGQTWGTQFFVASSSTKTFTLGATYLIFNPTHSCDRPCDRPRQAVKNFTACASNFISIQLPWYVECRPARARLRGARFGGTC